MPYASNKDLAQPANRQSSWGFDHLPVDSVSIHPVKEH